MCKRGSKPIFATEKGYKKTIFEHHNNHPAVRAHALQASFQLYWLFMNLIKNLFTKLDLIIDN